MKKIKKKRNRNENERPKFYGTRISERQKEEEIRQKIKN